MADTFIATETLYVGVAPAHQAGDEVPAENVERNGWQDKVARRASRDEGGREGRQDRLEVAPPPVA